MRMPRTRRPPWSMFPERGQRQVGVCEAIYELEAVQSGLRCGVAVITLNYDLSDGLIVSFPAYTEAVIVKSIVE